MFSLYLNYFYIFDPGVAEGYNVCMTHGYNRLIPYYIHGMTISDASVLLHVLLFE